MAFRSNPGRDQFYALATFRRDGTPVSTPIWLAPDGEHLYGYTPGRTGKVRRLGRDPRVQVAPSDFHGTAQGHWCDGRALVLTGRSVRTARRAMRRKYGLKFLFFVVIMVVTAPRKRGGAAVGLQITLDNDDDNGADHFGDVRAG